MKITETKRRAVAEALRQYGRSLEDWTRFKTKASRMHGDTANVFLLGVMFDHSGKYQLAWDAGEWMCSSLGDSEDPGALWQALARMESRRLRGFLRYGNRGKAFHRYYKTFARILPEAANHILENYQGDPRRVWNNERDVNQVERRLDEIPGIGPGLSRMAVLMLARRGRIGGRKARRDLEPKPDVHVRRVFERAGLIERGAPNTAIFQVARHLAPDFPASLDAPAWQIGRNWCRPAKSNCSECAIGTVCPKVRTRQRSR